MTTNSREYARKYYAEHKEMFRESSKRYQEKKKLEKKLKKSNPQLFDMRENYKAEVKEKFQSIPKKELTYSQRYYAENREKIRAQQKESRERRKRRRNRENIMQLIENICVNYKGKIMLKGRERKGYLKLF